MVREKKIKIANKDYKFQWLKGKILEVKSLSHTRGGGTIYTSSHGYSSGNINIHGIEELNVFLEDSNGDELAFKLENFNFSCREGHEITIIKMIVNNSNHDPFVGLFNHNTKEFKTKFGLLQSASRPSSSFYWLLALVSPIPIFISIALGFDFLIGSVDGSNENASIIRFLSFITIIAVWIMLLVFYQKKKSGRYNRLVSEYKKLNIQ
ncbi:hypothetical protein [Confluentibacter lentus]|uniref:hypothetical protein n=1 Tax=Confluentibacter lentus TaxID=1699412 RepID=UPI000C29239F|nr:hypothetical protein [Confluentibacter lentus]